MLAIFACCRVGSIGALSWPESICPCRDYEAGDESLDVPFPRRGECLVEIIQVEDEASLRRSVDSEIRQMGIAARLHNQATRRSSCQIAGHHGRGSPQEGKWRGEHPAVPDRYEVLQRGPRPVPSVSRADWADQLEASRPHARIEGHSGELPCPPPFGRRCWERSARFPGRSPLLSWCGVLPSQSFLRSPG